MENDPRFADNPHRRLEWTDMSHDGGEVGNNHSLYLYLQRSNVQQVVWGAPSNKVMLTAPFVTPLLNH